MSDRLVDVIKEGQIITIPESQARHEELFVLRVHEKRDLVASLPSIESRRRSGRTSAPLAPVKSPPKWHSYQSTYKKNNVVKELIDNFHWEVGKARKARAMTRLQLANAVGFPEAVIKMVENGELPSDDFILVNKLQSFLGINLRRDGKTFETPVTRPSSAASSKGPAYVSKPDFTRSDLSLSDLQKIKEKRDRSSSSSGEQSSKSDISGNDIELFD